MIVAQVGLAAACAAVGIGLVVSPVASSEEGGSLITVLHAETPRCAAHDGASVIGRVAGILGSQPERAVSLTGCFPSFPSCEAWKRPVAERLGGMVVVASCDYRR